MDCKLCEFQHDDLKKLANHIRSEHELSSEDYTVKVYHDGVKPVCKVCQAPVRYVSFSFKTFCKDHSHLAMKEGGSHGGKAEAWNRGKTKQTDDRIKQQSEKMMGTGNPFYGRHHTQDTIQKISLNKMLVTSTLKERLSIRASEFLLITPIDQYVSRQAQYLTLQCTKCGELQPKTLQAFERGSRCYRCYPAGKSNWELDVFTYVQNITPDVISGDKSVISPKEIDVYVPSKKFGIECHGLYWHSAGARQDGVFNKNKHLEKAILVANQEIRLLQIFEDEWRDKRAICESMILHRLGLDPHRCKTWSTKVMELSSKEQREFFDSTHISGYVPSKIAFGLKDRNNNIVAALSLRMPRHGKKYEGYLEIARFSTAAMTSVPGGLSKLLKRAKLWCKLNGYQKLMTYVDRRIGDGSGYKLAGFNCIGATDADYWYTDNYLRYDRFKFRAKNGKTEKQIVLDSKVSRIYGCGSSIFSLSFL